MTCRLIEKQIDDFLDETLTAEAQASAESHIDECSECRQIFERARSLAAAIKKLPVDGPAPDFLDRALRTAAEKSEVEKKTSRTPHRRYFIGMAAAAALAVFGAALLERSVDEPDSAGGVATVALAVEETRTINLVFASDQALADVDLTVELPDGIELAMYPGQRRIEWSTRLQSGKNVLPLELVALGGSGGELVATMQRDGREKVFRIEIAVLTG